MKPRQNNYNQAVSNKNTNGSSNEDYYFHSYLIRRTIGNLNDFSKKIDRKKLFFY